jgi:ribosome-associated protein
LAATRKSPIKAKKAVKQRKVVAKSKPVTPKKNKPVKISIAQPFVATQSYPPLVAAVLKQLDDAKAEQIVTLDLVNKSTIADTMIVASGRSDRHVNAIADQVVITLEKAGQKNVRVEGKPQCDWVLVDSGDIIIHVFRPEVRSFYNLEKLWSANAPKEPSA